MEFYERYNQIMKVDSDVQKLSKPLKFAPENLD